MNIKEPLFESPGTVGTSGDIEIVRHDTAPISVGTRVMLVYLGSYLVAQVTEIEVPDVQFVARILGFDNQLLEHGDLKSDDLARFKRSDIRMVG